MTEWVVTLRNGQRHDVESESSFLRFREHVEFRQKAAPPRWWPTEQVTLVQRRDGHLLEQVWPVPDA